MNYCLCYIFSFLFTLSANYHPIHVAILNADLIKGKPSIDLSFKVFANDLELAIAHNYSVALNLGKPNENPNAVTYINKYISGLFSVKINNNYQADLVFTKKVINEDAVWIYFKIPLKEAVKELDISDMVFLDIYEDQVNLMILAINGKEFGYRFNFKQRDVKIKI
jgi:hypothetical protein